MTQRHLDPREPLRERRNARGWRGALDVLRIAAFGVLGSAAGLFVYRVVRALL